MMKSSAPAHEIEDTAVARDLHAMIGGYTDSFVSASHILREKKEQGIVLDKILLDEIFSDVYLRREDIYSLIRSGSDLQRQDFASLVGGLYTASTGMEKRSLIDIRAFIMNEGILY